MSKMTTTGFMNSLKEMAVFIFYPDFKSRSFSIWEVIFRVFFWILITIIVITGGIVVYYRIKRYLEERQRLRVEEELRMLKAAVEERRQERLFRELAVKRPKEGEGISEEATEPLTTSVNIQMEEDCKSQLYEEVTPGSFKCHFWYFFFFGCCMALTSCPLCRYFLRKDPSRDRPPNDLVLFDADEIKKMTSMIQVY